MFLADDDPHLSAVLRDHLYSYDQFDLVGSALSAEEALDELGRQPVDVLLLDIKLPRMSGLEALSHFKQLKPNLKIVIITSLTPGEAELLAIKEGADGYVCKEGGFAQFLADLIQAVELVSRGKLFFDLGVWRAVAPLLKETPTPTRLQPKLTARETEVLLLLVEGLSSKEIAARLRRSKRTVDKHRQRLMKRLKIHGTANLVRYAIDSGLFRLQQRN
jgi:DNA-binding NarL/FixJ family response regulator